MLNVRLYISACVPTMLAANTLSPCRLVTKLVASNAQTFCVSLLEDLSWRRREDQRIGTVKYALIGTQVSRIIFEISLKNAP